MTSDLESSYRHCRAVVRRASSNLASTFWLLPGEQRRGMDALYAFARQADDLVDSDEPLAVRRKQFAEFRRAISIRLTGGGSESFAYEIRGPLTLLPAVEDTVQRFEIPPTYLLEMLDGVEMDLHQSAYVSFDDLRVYCYRVASVIGLSCLPIWGCRDARAAGPAIDCGLAFQLTNILRDIREDAERGRVYLPTDELGRFGLAPTDILSGANEDGWQEFLQFQVARAESFFESGAATRRYLPAAGRRVFHLMLARYQAILGEVKRRRTGVLRERVQLSYPHKLLIAAGSLWGSGSVFAPGEHPSPTDAAAKTLPDPVASGVARDHGVAIVGGGLAGLAAAAALCERGIRVEIFEAKRRLGGRAGSYMEQDTGQAVDHCQHVAMGCCTTFLGFCRRTGIIDQFERHRTLHFFGPEGQKCDFRGSRWLPAPLHLGPALMGLTYLSLGERMRIAFALLKLARLPAKEQPCAMTIGAWLQQQKQSPRCIERFWQVVLVSALGESLNRASLTAARKVFVDGFMSSREAGDVWIPKVPLTELYERIAVWLTKRGVAIRPAAAVERIEPHQDGELSIQFREGPPQNFGSVICAVPWRQAAEILPAAAASHIPVIHSAPITSLHLWFDRPMTPLPHAVLVGQLSQWVFARSPSPGSESGVGFQPAQNQESAEHYYQVVISASHELTGREREDVVREVLGDLNAVFPLSRDAKLLRWRIITEGEAVFSVRPGLEVQRPSQQTSVPNLFLAGDWTATGWPSTMESAVRSGYLAADGVMHELRRWIRVAR
ncbi:MAG: squalene/phytoene synthase family protein [Pirellulaceae bacterium]|nr:squalene/phytoene synthase family protein [Pirellulaceae bacterium]